MYSFKGFHQFTGLFFIRIKYADICLSRTKQKKKRKKNHLLHAGVISKASETHQSYQSARDDRPSKHCHLHKHTHTYAHTYTPADRYVPLTSHWPFYEVINLLKRLGSFFYGRCRRVTTGQQESSCPSNGPWKNNGRGPLSLTGTGSSGLSSDSSRWLGGRNQWLNITRRWNTAAF